MNIHMNTNSVAVQSTVETITPTLAAAYLERNTQNRSLRPIHVERMANDILEGRWVFNGATVVFGADGNLLDGQHRLAAIVKANISVPIMVVRNVSKDAMMTIDGNIPRKANDVAKLHGFSYSRRITSSARLLLSLKFSALDVRKYGSNSEMIAFLTKHPELQQAAAETDKTCDILPQSITIAWFYLAKYRSGLPHKASEALNVLISGIPSYPGDPLHVFRERIIRMDSSQKSQMTARITLLATLIAAWNDFLAGEKAAMCKLRKPFVKMIGVDYSAL